MEVTEVVTLWSSGQSRKPCISTGGHTHLSKIENSLFSGEQRMVVSALNSEERGCCTLPALNLEGQHCTREVGVLLERPLRCIISCAKRKVMAPRKDGNKSN